MNLKKTKILIAAFFVIFAMFFSNDFGLINIEKTAIVTAVALDKGKTLNYSVTAQVAVPEATDSNTENPKAVLNGEGNTVAEALKRIGSVSGWYPKLSFCNLIIIGESLYDDSVIKELDFFAKTLNVQDSALVIAAEKSAEELLETASPLDDISSFALQKVLLKEPGFDSDVTPVDLRAFVQGTYSRSKSSFMPLVKILRQDSSKNGKTDSESGEGGGAESGQEEEKVLFDASTTALFKDGVMVGELQQEMTLTFKILTNSLSSTTFPISVEKDGRETDYLINAVRNTPKIKTTANDDGCSMDISLSLYCKIVDQNSKRQDTENSRNVPLDEEIINAIKIKFENNVSQLTELLKKSKCDIFGTLDDIYKYSHTHYETLKNDYMDKLKYSVSISVTGQR